MENIIILFVGILSAIVAFISATFKMYDAQSPSIVKITIPGMFFILCAITLVILPVVQNKITERNQKKERVASELRLKRGYDSSMLLMQMRFEEGHNESVSTITEVLAKYGYKLDSTNMALVSIRDSAGQKIIMPEDPLVGIPTSFDDDRGGIILKNETEKTYGFQVYLYSNGAASAFFDLTASLIFADSVDYVYPPGSRPIRLIDYEDRIPKNGAKIISFELPKTPNAKKLIIWLRGSYKKLDGTGNFGIDEVYQYDLSTHRVIMLTRRSKEYINRFIKLMER